MNLVLSIFVLFAVSVSCKRSAKNECTYRETVYPAKIIELEPQGGPSIYDGPLDISFEINLTRDRKDTIYYNAVMGEFIETNEILKNKIAEGKVYKYVTGSLVSGNCPGVINKIQLQEFKSP